MNFAVYNSTILDLKRSFICNKPLYAIEVNSGECESVGGSDNEFDQSSVMELLNKCEEFVTSATCSAACNMSEAFSLCSKLMEDRVLWESDSVHRSSSPVPKSWLFLALGFQILNDLISLNSVGRIREEGNNGCCLKDDERENERKQLNDLACRRIPILLEHPEQRIRKMCSEVLFLIALDERTAYEVINIQGENDPMMHDVLQHDAASSEIASASGVQSHFPLYRSIGNHLLTKVTADLNRTTTSRFTNMGDESFIALDDTTGWFSLESSILSLHGMFRGYGSSLAAALTEHSAESLSTEGESYSFQNVFDLLIEQASVHVNRHIRETVYELIRILSISLDGKNEDKKEELIKSSAENEARIIIKNDAREKSKEAEECLSYLFLCTVDALKIGMEDNWCQIRRSAVLAAKSFLQCNSFTELSDLKHELGVSAHVKSDSNACNGCSDNTHFNKDEVWDKLLPGLCMNRFYVADGVSTIAREVWHDIINKHGKGRETVTAHISAIVDHYIFMSKASNHMVCEASLLALSEVILRIDRRSLYQNIPRIAENILFSLHSESWPVKDSATIASGSLLKEYSEECRTYVPEFIESWCASLQNPIWSVRENSSNAFGDVLNGVNTDIKNVIYDSAIEHLNTNILAAVRDSLVDDKPAQFIPPDMLKFMAENEKAILKKSKINSMNNNANHSNGGHSHMYDVESTGQSVKISWGCCLDCMELRKGSPAETSDGCIYLLKNLTSTHPDVVLSYLPQIYEILLLKDLKKYHKLHANIFAQIPVIFQMLSGYNDREPRQNTQTLHPDSTPTLSNLNTASILNSTDSNPSLTAGLLKSSGDEVEVSPMPVLTLTLGKARGRGGRGGLSGTRGEQSSDTKENLSGNTNNAVEGSQVPSTSCDIKSACVGGDDKDMNVVTDQSGALSSHLNGVPNSLLNIGISGTSKGRSKGVLAAKLFVEEHYLALHSALLGEYALTSSAAEDCVGSIAALIGPSIFMHRIPHDLKHSFQVVVDSRRA